MIKNVCQSCTKRTAFCSKTCTKFKLYKLCKLKEYEKKLQNSKDEYSLTNKKSIKKRRVY